MDGLFTGGSLSTSLSSCFLEMIRDGAVVTFLDSHGLEIGNVAASPSARSIVDKHATV